MKKALGISGLILIALFAVIFFYPHKNRMPFFPSSIVSLEGKGFLIANAGSKDVVHYDETFQKVLQRWHFEDSPTGIAVNENTAFVTTFGTKGQVHFINLKSGKTEKTIETGSGACHPLLSACGKFLFVNNRFRNTISRMEIESGQVTGTANVLREPAVSVLDKTGDYLFAANFLPHQSAKSEIVAASVSVIRTGDMESIKNIVFPNGSNALQGICRTADDKYILVTHNIGRFGLPTNQLLQGWMNNSAMTLIDAETLEYAGTVLLDEPENGAAGPWGIIAGKNHIIITHSGTHEISLIDYNLFIEKFESFADKNSLTYDLRFLQGIRKRIPIHGNGPRSVILYENSAVVKTFYADILNIINVDTHAVKPVTLNPGRHESNRDKGERIFNDASYCFQTWQSCNGCHPGDGRADGLNWDLLNDGIGNPKNTKSLLYSHVTPPAMISGIRDKAETAVRKGFTHIQFASIPEEYAVYVDEYLKSLSAVPSPYLEDGKLSLLAEAGKEVFEKFNCTDCHTGTYHTDLKMYRIGDDVEFEKGWDTPTLSECWRTGPWLFDGRAATLYDVFSVHRHGISGTITDKEINQLVEYVKSL
jgi:hypothetical protein